jgi:hypothetical protein
LVRTVSPSRVNDGKYDSNVATVSLQVNAPPTAPDSIALSSTQIPNTKPSGAWIADLSSQDVNTGEAHTYTLVAGAGSTDNARFTISGHQLRAAQSFAVPPGTTYEIRIRSTDAAALFLEQTFVLTVIAPPASVVVNEVHYNGVDNTVRNEFIELFNNSAASQDLTGWRLSGAIDYTFPAGTSIAPGRVSPGGRRSRNHPGALFENCARALGLARSAPRARPSGSAMQVM